MKDRLFILTIFALAVFLTPFFAGGAGIAVQAETEPPVFPASVRLLLTETGEVVTLSAEDYIVGCLAAQIPIDYEPEALKAQAAASATYAMRLMLDFRSSGEGLENADLSDNTALCQPYMTHEDCIAQYGEAYSSYRDNLLEAARYGLAHIMTYDDEPIYAVYHSVSAGRTCSAYPVWGREIPYLQPADSIEDKEYINYLCTNEMTTEAARLALAAYKSDIETPVDCAKWFTEMNANEDGYVISVRIGKNLFSGGDIWRIFGLRSTAFTVSYMDGIFTFTTKGYGHGAGLSQYGAQCMAKGGSAAEEILRHYYGEEIIIP